MVVGQAIGKTQICGNPKPEDDLILKVLIYVEQTNYLFVVLGY